MGRRGWALVRARVKAKRESGKIALTAGSSGVTGLGRKRYEYVVEVSPGDGAARFTATMVTPLFVDHWLPLDEGDAVSVLRKPGTEEVRWDRSEASTSRRAQLKAFEEAERRSEDDKFDSALEGGDKDSANKSGQRESHRLGG